MKTRTLLKWFVTTVFIFISVNLSAQDIAGPGSIVCGTTATYSIDGCLRTGEVVTWSATGSVVISGSNTGASVNVTVVDLSTLGSISAVISKPGCTCTCCTISLSKTITPLPLPAAPQMYIDGVPFDGSSTVFLQRLTEHTLSIDPIPNATSYFWSIGEHSILNFGQGTTSVDIIISGSPGQSLTFAVQGVNSCGRGGGFNVSGEITDGGFAMVNYYPNPANNSLVISTKPVAVKTPNATQLQKLSPFTYEIYDSKGKLWKQGKSEDGNDVSANVKDMPADTYYLHVTINKKTTRKQIIIKH